MLFGVVWQGKEFKFNRNTECLKSLTHSYPHRNVVVASEARDAVPEELF